MLARLLFRSAENPSIPLSQADDDLYEAFGAAPSLTGIRVSRSKAMTYAALYRSVAMISADVAKLPVQVFRRLPDGGRERDPSHPASRLLRRAPNALQDPVQFFSLLMCWALLDGNAYAWIGRDGSGAPVELNHPTATNALRQIFVRRTDKNLLDPRITTGMDHRRSQAVVRLKLPHRPHHDPERLERFFKMTKLPKQGWVDACIGLVAGPEIIPERFDNMVSRHSDVGDVILEHRQDRTDDPTHGSDFAAIGVSS